MKVLVGFDDSPDAAVAIAVGAALFPEARAHIAHVWMPPFTVHPSPAQVREARTVDGLIRVLEEQGRARADQVIANGMALASVAGWTAEPVSRRGFAGEGLELARLAEEIDANVLIVGARGLSGVRALLGSVSDAVAHYSLVPVLVVPRRGSDDLVQAARSGSVITAFDGSEGAALALAMARRLWPSREHVVASVGCAGDEDFVSDGEMATLHHAHRPVLAVPPPTRLGAAARGPAGAAR
jgi:nucleotide-binding universal stress UspA family protein